MSSFFTLTNLDYIYERSKKFRFSSCALYGDYAAFGNSAGSIHIFSLSQKSPPIIISISSLINSVELLSFSPSGKWLVMGDSKELHFIEDPTGTASLFFSIDFKGGKPTAVVWTSEPPGKLIRTPFLIAGDSNGQIWQIKHQSSDLIASLPGSIIQLSMINDNILAATSNGTFIIQENTITTVGHRSPVGEFGAIYADCYNAICLARPGGKLSFATTEGRVKASLPFAPSEPLKGATNEYSHLMFCQPFLISSWKKTVCYIVNLTSASLIHCTTDFSDLIDCSNDQTRILFLCKQKIVLFKVCATDIEYISCLISLDTKESLTKARELTIQLEITDEDILEKLKGVETPSFDDYLEKVKMKDQPKPIEQANATLYQKLIEEDIPTEKTMNEVNELRSFLIIDDFLLEKIEKYVLSNPKDYEKWINELNVDKIVPILHQKEETAQYAISISKYGKSDLCKLLQSIDTLPLDFCVANSPPLYPYDFVGKRRLEFEAKLREYDIFASDDNEKQKEDEEILHESFYAECIEKIDENNINEEKTFYLLKLYNWEKQINETIEELRSTVNMFLLTKDIKGIPEWVKVLLDNGKRIEKDGNGNWGIPVKLSVCPICGMSHNLGESVCSVAVFPCNHICHVSCLHTRCCPICYSNSLN
ncbi:hypothetical protein GPJ56_008112 [Histomonas meleagridis]|uniref:uncharacterized protein n=1 Tax=Histomonas meleagridis TaxID=135588 RepID=UPI00355A1265|nr:hypothetical protein GPJ56_008112 [Histomonas meleagridis]KAH0798937.1 hypothetical protein GO595_008227 [Histomonas meleagridis]